MGVQTIVLEDIDVKEILWPYGELTKLRCPLPNLIEARVDALMPWTLISFND